MPERHSNSGTILLFAPTDVGGIAEHLVRQVGELQKAGVSCTVLTTRNFLEGRPVPFAPRQVLFGAKARGGNRYWRAARNAACLILNQWILALYVIRLRPSIVFYESYSEYYSPLWIWPHWFLARVCGFLYGNNLHDPVRHFQLGPRWWHRLSVWLAWRPFRFVLVHQEVPAAANLPSGVRAHVVPVGIYEMPPSTADLAETRQRLGARDGQFLVLSFGFLRDDKNVDLFIEAMPDYPQVALAIVGRSQTSAMKPIEFYQDLAKKVGVADRVTFRTEFIADDQVAALFEASEAILLVYDKTFVSQSGVLNIAAALKRPVLASGGPGPMQDAVVEYSLGEFVAPDSLGELKTGIRNLLSGDAASRARWDDYARFASWATNVRPLVELAREQVRS